MPEEWVAELLKHDFVSSKCHLILLLIHIIITTFHAFQYFLPKILNYLVLHGLDLLHHQRYQ